MGKKYNKNGKNSSKAPRKDESHFSQKNFRPPNTLHNIIKGTTTAQPKLTNILAIDCEYVGTGYEGRDDQLARVSIVNVDGECLYDKYVRPTEPVVDYRTHVSGIRPGHLAVGEPFQQVQQEVSKMIAGKTIVGHALHNDLKVLGLTHPTRLIRDTAKYRPLRQMADNIQKTPSLKHLANHLLGIQIQSGAHDSIVDAKIALRIYLMHSKKWDEEMHKLRNRKKIK